MDRTARGKGFDARSRRVSRRSLYNFRTLPDRSCCCLYSAHVHLNQPGRTSWEGFSSGTLAAISGGVTTVIDMPLNSIPSTTSVGALEVKIKAARYGWENWKSLEEAKRLPQIQNGYQTRFRSGTGIGPGWDETSIEEDDDGDSDQELALMNGEDPSEFKRIQRTGVTGSRRLLDILGPADVSAEGSRGVYCDVGFWGGIIPGNKVCFINRGTHM
jgi:dihydroorotase-like cyclic amidohydrolase